MNRILLLICALVFRMAVAETPRYDALECNGQTYRGVVVTRVTKEDVHIIHNTGTAKLPVSGLKPGLVDEIRATLAHVAQPTKYTPRKFLIQGTLGEGYICITPMSSTVRLECVLLGYQKGIEKGKVITVPVRSLGGITYGGKKIETFAAEGTSVSVAR